MKYIPKTDPTTWNDYAVLQTGRRWRSFHSYETFCQYVNHVGLPKYMKEFELAKYNVDKGYVINQHQCWCTMAYPPTEQKG